MSYKLTKAADQDIASLYRTGIERFGINQADRFLAGLVDTLDVIALFPMIARERHELAPPLRVHRYRSHLILYSVENEDVLIVRVRHGREDWENE
ncbi:type II toxin-antitoxin system RelE/ParE family toxin [Mangrovicella endophytica]|uniref:type II toxin-antitoxin system RelE/ParE family toxin n=1 Tax=Mangrovicella endophytica TaxID=2066697 RepID=UPI000C9DD0C5|nr:type II toxin-antitoxin system RelE/ParE family toxin [Mangrovicella endophytica]